MQNDHQSPQYGNITKIQNAVYNKYTSDNEVCPIWNQLTSYTFREWLDESVRPSEMLVPTYNPLGITTQNYVLDVTEVDE